jgi:hypothetical protein
MIIEINEMEMIKEYTKKILETENTILENEKVKVKIKK